MTTNFKKLLSIGSIVLLFVVIGSYGYFRAKDLIHGVRIVVDNIHDGDTITTPLITVKGRAEHAVRLTINDRLITTDQAGAFQETLFLPQGYTIMSLKAEDTFGHTAEKNLHLVLKT